MKDFPEWYKELCSDVRWFEYTSMNHKGKNFKKAAEFVYAQLLADTRLQLRDMSENRKHVYNKLGNMPFENVFPQLQQTEEVTVDEQWQPASAENVDKYVAEIQKIIAESPMMNSMPRIGYKQSIEEGGWLPPKQSPYPSTSLNELYVKERHLEYIKANYEPRTAHPLPTWLPETEWNKIYDEKNFSHGGEKQA